MLLEPDHNLLFLPERVTYTVLKVNEVVLVDSHQVTTVEVKISFSENIPKSLPLGLLLILGVADKRGNVSDLRHQQSRLTWRTATRFAAALCELSRPTRRISSQVDGVCLLPGSI